VVVVAVFELIEQDVVLRLLEVVSLPYLVLVPNNQVEERVWTLFVVWRIAVWSMIFRTFVHKRGIKTIINTNTTEQNNKLFLNNKNALL